MTSLTRTVPLLGISLASAAALAACNPVEEVSCPLAKCSFQGDQGVHVTIENALEKFSGDLPATVTTCVGRKCSEASLRIAGKSFACISDDIRITCEVTDDGKLMIDYAVQVPTEKEKPSSVRVSVQGASGANLFEETKDVPVLETYPAGPDCPTVCRESNVTFSATGEPAKPGEPGKPGQPGQPGQPSPQPNPQPQPNPNPQP